MVKKCAVLFGLVMFLLGQPGIYAAEHGGKEPAGAPAKEHGGTEAANPAGGVAMESSDAEVLLEAAEALELARPDLAEKLRAMAGQG